MDEKRRLGIATMIVVLAFGCSIWGAASAVFSAIFWLIYTVLV